MYGPQFPTLWALRQQSGANLRARPSTPEHTHRRTRGSVPHGGETLDSSPTASPEERARPSRHSYRPAAGPAPEEGAKPAGWGQVIPGDFTLFEARVFRDRRCHSGGFSLLLHWHLPPSPARWTGRPGRGFALRRRPRSTGSCLPGTAAEARDTTPPWVSFLGLVRDGSAFRPAVSQLGLSSGRERRQRGT